MAFLPLIEVSSDLQSYPRSVRTHLQQEVNRDHEAPMLGTVARSGKITAVAKVLLRLRSLQNLSHVMFRAAIWT